MINFSKRRLNMKKLFFVMTAFAFALPAEAAGGSHP
jgi:hypothetical protein